MKQIKPDDWVYYVCRNVWSTGRPYLKVQVNEEGQIFGLDANQGIGERYIFLTKKAALEYVGSHIETWEDQFPKAYAKYLQKVAPDPFVVGK